jgi:hypothetical protein
MIYLKQSFGDLPQPDLSDYEVIERDDGSFLVDAQIPFYDFLTHFEKAEWMHEGEQEFDTLAGFILHRLERIPHTGDKLDWKGFHIEIMDMDGTSHRQSNGENKQYTSRRNERIGASRLSLRSRLWREEAGGWMLEVWMSKLSSKFQVGYSDFDIRCSIFGA